MGTVPGSPTVDSFVEPFEALALDLLDILLDLRRSQCDTEGLQEKGTVERLKELPWGKRSCRCRSLFSSHQLTSLVSMAKLSIRQSTATALEEAQWTSRPPIG